MAYEGDRRWLDENPTYDMLKKEVILSYDGIELLLDWVHRLKEENQKLTDQLSETEKEVTPQHQEGRQADATGEGSKGTAAARPEADTAPGGAPKPPAFDGVPQPAEPQQPAEVQSPAEAAQPAAPPPEVPTPDASSPGVLAQGGAPKPEELQEPGETAPRRSKAARRRRRHRENKKARKLAQTGEGEDAPAQDASSTVGIDQGQGDQLQADTEPGEVEVGEDAARAEVGEEAAEAPAQEDAPPPQPEDAPPQPEDAPPGPVQQPGQRLQEEQGEGGRDGHAEPRRWSEDDEQWQEVVAMAPRHVSQGAGRSGTALSACPEGQARNYGWICDRALGGCGTHNFDTNTGAGAPRDSNMQCQFADQTQSVMWNTATLGAENYCQPTPGTAGTSFVPYADWVAAPAAGPPPGDTQYPQVPPEALCCYADPQTDAGGWLAPRYGQHGNWPPTQCGSIPPQQYVQAAPQQYVQAAPLQYEPAQYRIVPPPPQLPTAVPPTKLGIPVPSDNLIPAPVSANSETGDAVGELLYTAIAAIDPARAAKLTGMILERDGPGAGDLLGDPQRLVQTVREALQVLTGPDTDQLPASTAATAAAQGATRSYIPSVVRRRPVSRRGPL